MRPVDIDGKHIGVIARKSAVEWVAKSIHGPIAFKKSENDAVEFIKDADRVQKGVDSAKKEKQSEIPDNIMEAANISSAAFQRWFKGSKVVDPEGKPLLVYHGTTVPKFKRFKFPENRQSGVGMDGWWYGKGFYFTQNLGTAAMYSRRTTIYRDEIQRKSRVESFYLSIKNPYIVISSLPGSMMARAMIKDFGEDFYKEYPEWEEYTNPNVFIPLIATDYLMKKGYDGVIAYQGDFYAKYGPSRATEIVAYKPTQIMSAGDVEGAEAIYASNNEPSLQVAIKQGDKVYTDPDIIEHGELAKTLPKNTSDKRSIDGFVDNRGRFMDRKQAHKYAVEHELFHPRVRNLAMQQTYLITQHLESYYNRSKEMAASTKIKNTSNQPLYVLGYYKDKYPYRGIPIGDKVFVKRNDGKGHLLLTLDRIEDLGTLPPKELTQALKKAIDNSKEKTEAQTLEALDNGTRLGQVQMIDDTVMRKIQELHNGGLTAIQIARQLASNRGLIGEFIKTGDAVVVKKVIDPIEKRNKEILKCHKRRMPCTKIADKLGIGLYTVIRHLRDNNLDPHKYTQEADIDFDEEELLDEPVEPVDPVLQALERLVNYANSPRRQMVSKIWISYMLEMGYSPYEISVKLGVPVDSPMLAAAKTSKKKTTKKKPAPKKSIKARKEAAIKKINDENAELTPEKKAEWRSLTPKARAKYLKEHPDSKYKDVKVIDKYVTRSYKLSKFKDAQAITEDVKQEVANIGFGKSSNITRDKMLKAYHAIKGFAEKMDVRQAVIDRSKKYLEQVTSKLSRADKQEIEDDINDYQKVNHRMKFSTFANRTGKGKKVLAVLGVVGAAALVAGAFIAPDVAAFIGIKIADALFESARGGIGDVASGIFMGNALTKYFSSKDADEHVEEVEQKLEKTLVVNGKVPDLPEKEVPDDPAAVTEDTSNAETTKPSDTEEPTPKPAKQPDSIPL